MNDHLLMLYILLICCYCVLAESIRKQKTGDNRNIIFDNCNETPGRAVVFTDVNLSPNPIQMDENLILIVKLNLTETIGEHLNFIEVDFSLRLKTDQGYTDLCEILGEQKCHYNDACLFLERYIKENRCPKEFVEKYNNTCRCPFKKGQYNIIMPVYVKSLEFGLRGTFSLQLNLKDRGKQLGCVDIQFCITDCNPFGETNVDLKVSKATYEQVIETDDPGK